MYKLMIVDDEAIIRRELSKSFDWEAMGFTLACCTSSGEQALEKIKSEKIDALLLDIRMPGMDGLTALERIKNESPFTEVIILSAYDDFAYVKKGLKLGAFDYILKTDIINELESVFRKLKDELENRNKNFQEEEDTKKQKVLTDCLQGVVSRVLFWPEEPNTRIISLNAKHQPSFLPEGCITLKDLCLFPMVNRSERDESIIKSLLREGKVLGISNNYGNICSHRTMALQAIRSLDFPEPGKAVVYEELAGSFKPEKYSEEINKIKRKLLFGDDSFSQDLKQLYSLIFRNPNVLADQIRDIGHQLYFSLIEMIDESFRSDLKEDYIYLSRQIYAAEELSLSAQETINRLYRDYIFRQQYRFSGNIQRAQELIKSLYVSNLRLDEVAKAIDMSPSNFKLRFKEQTGKSFIAYLQYIRIRNACDLLVNTEMKIYEVADQVGYGDEKYFRKIFRQETGTNPREYRDSNKKSP